MASPELLVITEFDCKTSQMQLSDERFEREGTPRKGEISIGT